MEVCVYDSVRANIVQMHIGVELMHSGTEPACSCVESMHQNCQDPTEANQGSLFTPIYAETFFLIHVLECTEWVQVVNGLNQPTSKQLW